MLPDDSARRCAPVTGKRTTSRSDGIGTGCEAGHSPAVAYATCDDVVGAVEVHAVPALRGSRRGAATSSAGRGTRPARRSSDVPSASQFQKTCSAAWRDSRADRRRSCGARSAARAPRRTCRGDSRSRRRAASRAVRFTSIVGNPVRGAILPSEAERLPADEVAAGRERSRRLVAEERVVVGGARMSGLTIGSSLNRRVNPQSTTKLPAGERPFEAGDDDRLGGEGRRGTTTTRSRAQCGAVGAGRTASRAA
jgi:hypothetical protein